MVRSAAFILFLLLLCAGLPALAVEVRFHSEALVDHEQLSLAELADIQPAGQEASTLGQIIVVQAPVPGESRTIQTGAIAAGLRNHPALRGVQIHWSGADTIAITRDAIRIDQAGMQQIIAQYFEQHIDRLPQAEIRFSSFRAPSEVVLPTGQMAWKVLPSSPDIIHSSSFTIQFLVNDRLEKSATVRGNLQALAEVATAATSLRRGELVQADQIRMVRKNLLDYRAPIRSPDAVVGMQVKRSVNAGRVIEEATIQPAPVIREGELVRIVARRGALELTAKGIAATDGYAGELIRVRNISSNRLVHCRIEGPGKVSVEF